MAKDHIIIFFKDRELYDRAVKLLTAENFKFFGEATEGEQRLRIPTDVEARLHISLLLKKWGVKV